MNITFQSEWHDYIKDTLGTDLHTPVPLKIIPLDIDYKFWVEFYNNSPDKKSKTNRSKMTEIPSSSAMQERMIRSGYPLEKMEEWYINNKDEEILEHFGVNNVIKLGLKPEKTTFKIQVYFPSFGLPLHIDHYGSSTVKFTTRNEIC